MNSQLNGTTLFGKDSFLIPPPKINAKKIHKSEKVISDANDSHESNEILAQRFKTIDEEEEENRMFMTNNGINIE